VAHAALELVEPALEEDRYEVAEELANIGVAAATQLRDVELRKGAQELLKRVRDSRKVWIQHQPDFETLKKQPDDPDANLGAGKYLCFVKRDWPRGLPHLVKGSDPTLESLAEADLARPGEALKQVKLADRWRKFAESQPGLTKRGILLRAEYWWQRALPNLSGLHKVEAERSLAEISAAIAPPPRRADRPRIRPTPGRVFACCDDSFEMYVNGVSVLSGHGARTVFTKDYSFARGDVITVQAKDIGGERGFCCVIAFQKRRPITTALGWKAYRPKPGAEWFLPESIEATGQVFASSKLTEGSSKQLYDKCGIVAPAIWAQGNPNPCYLTLTIP
jgi:hypothetical protein